MEAAIVLQEGGEGILIVWVAGGELKRLRGLRAGNMTDGDEI